MWNVLAAVSLGALTGILLGLSASPVVGSVLGALIAGILVFLSLSNLDGGASTTPLTKTKLIRLTVFSISAIAAALFGIQMRSDQWFGTSQIQQQYRDLLSIEVPKDDARAAILERFKATPLDVEVDRHRSPVLFGAEVTADQCKELDPEKLGSAQSVLVRYESAGGPWQEIAQNVKAFAPSNEMAILKFAHAIQCEKIP